MNVAQLETASVGYPITREWVSFFPVYIHQRPRLITTGAASGVTIQEAPEAQVPTIQVANDTGTPVLLVEGETVTGGRQSRMLNVSVLVPPTTVLDIPVSCVEQGRWGGQREFGRGRTLAPRRVRREKARTVAESVQKGGGKRSDQGAVWQAVALELQRLDAHNPTASLLEGESLFDRDDRKGRAVEELIARGPLPGQCGIVVSHGSRIVAVDVFSDPDSLACHWEGLVRAHLLDAPDEVRGRPSITRAVRFLRKFATAEARVAPGVGLGREHHVSNRKVVGQALVWDDVLVHASAFALAA